MAAPSRCRSQRRTCPRRPCRGAPVASEGQHAQRTRDRHVVPRRRAPEHVVAHRAHVAQLGGGGHAAGALDVRRGRAVRRDAVVAAVCGKEVPAGQAGDPFPGGTRAPDRRRRQRTRRRPPGSMSGRPWSGRAGRRAARRARVVPPPGPSGRPRPGRRHRSTRGAGTAVARCSRRHRARVGRSPTASSGSVARKHSDRRRPVGSGPCRRAASGSKRAVGSRRRTSTTPALSRPPPPHPWLVVRRPQGARWGRLAVSVRPGKM